MWLGVVKIDGHLWARWWNVMSCKCVEFFDQQTNCYLQRKDSALWTRLLSHVRFWANSLGHYAQWSSILDTLYNDVQQLDTRTMTFNNWTPPYYDAQQLNTRKMTLNNWTPFKMTFNNWTPPHGDVQRTTMFNNWTPVQWSSTTRHPVPPVVTMTPVKE